MREDISHLFAQLYGEDTVTPIARKARHLNLLDTREFPRLAVDLGITQPAEALMFDGRLLRIFVGRRSYFRWDDLLALMPDWSREVYAYLGTSKAGQMTVDLRDDLVDQPHTITIERLDDVSAIEVNMRDQAGHLVVVERHHGRIGKVMEADPDTIERAADNTAHTYGATYVPAVTR